MKHRPVFFLLAILCFLFLLLGNSQLAVTDPVESNYALTAKEMVLSGDWISPQIYGTYWFDKPIFIYWMLCISYTLCGFTDFASRLPGALFGTASVVLAAWYMLRRTGRMTAALVVAAMTVTSLAVWAISHSIITDQMLFFFTSAAMFFAYQGPRRHRPAGNVPPRLHRPAPQYAVYQAPLSACRHRPVSPRRPVLVRHDVRPPRRGLYRRLPGI